MDAIERIVIDTVVWNRNTAEFVELAFFPNSKVWQVVEQLGASQSIVLCKKKLKLFRYWITVRNAMNKLNINP